jgi:hypothetical protein
MTGIIGEKSKSVFEAQVSSRKLGGLAPIQYHHQAVWAHYPQEVW